MNRQINEEAARWFVEFRSGDFDDAARREFDAWMRASPEHLRAFIEIARLWGYSAELDTLDRYPQQALIERARAQSKVVPLSESTRPEVQSRRFPRWLAAASVLLVVCASIATWSVLRERQLYTTEVGEQRSLRLVDGSVVTLNSRSQVRIRFNPTTRGVDLLEGEALFRVARDPSRPFIVRSEGDLVRAVGTEFDIDRRRHGSIVTVVEGRVAVSLATGRTGPSLGTQRFSEHALQVSAGEQLDTGAGSPQPTRADAGSATAWIQGRLILESATLEDVAERFNRYSQRRLVTEDHGDVPFRVSGVFLTDPEFLLNYLRERPEIELHESATEIRIVRNGTQ